MTPNYGRLVFMDFCNPGQEVAILFTHKKIPQKFW